MASEANALFYARVKPAVDFAECSDGFNEDACTYLIFHSGDYCRLAEESRENHAFLADVCGLERYAQNRITTAVTERETILADFFWTLGMTAAAKAAEQPDFDVSAFFSAHKDGFKTPAYDGAVKELDAAYEAADGGDALRREKLTRNRALQERMLRYQVASNCLHGFEWAAGALKQAGLPIADESAEAFYQIFR